MTKVTQCFIGLASFMLLFYIAGCSNDSENKAVDRMNGQKDLSDNDTLKDSANTNLLKVDPGLNDIAQIIGGVTDTSNQFKEIQNYSSFKTYSKDIKDRFSSFSNRMLLNFGKWSEKELKDLRGNTKNVFYPFSGPDIAYAYTIFPNAENYVMLGLEPVGFLPEIDSADENQIKAVLKSVTYSVRDNMSYSFFKTKNMRKDFSKDVVKGTVPVLLFYMANLGLEIVELNYVKVNASGDIVPSDKNDPGAGAKISFLSSKGKSTRQHVYYFSKDISNSNASFMKSLSAWCSKMDSVTTFVKSSSYCMHSEGQFSAIRTIILSNTDALVQDDTGIPFKYFNDSTTWNYSLYGKYSHPIRLFASKDQPDFREAMKSAQPINFKFGYNNPSNITVVRRKK